MLSSIFIGLSATSKIKLHQKMNRIGICTSVVICALILIALKQNTWHGRPKPQTSQEAQLHKEKEYALKFVSTAH